MVNHLLISLALTSPNWQANWPYRATFFVYPTDIRKVIYTTNAIETLNSVIRHAIKKRKVFPTDDSVKKAVWLAIMSASQKWMMPLKDWRMAMRSFIIEFGDRLDGHFREMAFTQKTATVHDVHNVRTNCNTDSRPAPDYQPYRNTC